MTVPYDRIKVRVNLSSIPCAMCTAITVMPVIDHCHEHGWTRGVLCMTCNARMARVDADLSIATPGELFHWENCPACRREGHAGVARRMASPSRRNATRRVQRTVVRATAPRRALDDLTPDESRALDLLVKACSPRVPSQGAIRRALPSGPDGRRCGATRAIRIQQEIRAGVNA